MVKKELRPTTATLIKPTILDTKLLGIFDMTTVSREHLVAIKNLVHTTPRCKCRTMTKSHSVECDQKCQTAQNQEKIQKMYKVLNKTYRIRTNVRQKLHNLAEASEIIERPVIVPAPCSTCGRSDQPERFHSHPSRAENQRKCIKSSIEEKKTVQKPVAMKFRSAKTKLEEEKDKETSKNSPSNSKLKVNQSSKLHDSNSVTKKLAEVAPQPPPPSSDKENTPKRKLKIPTRWREAFKKTVQQKKAPSQDEKFKPKEEINKDASEGGYKLDSWNPAPVSGGRKRKVVCYLCSQEFGTAILPAHEAMCIQASLVPCDYCERKFLPARLEAHQRICASKSTKEPIKNKVTNVGISNQPGILCEHCGKRYGSNSITIHKEQCIKKHRNSANDETNTSRQDNNKENSATRKTSAPLTVICNICGRNFGTKSIAFHEPQCLKKWKLENEKLPAQLQKSPIFKSNVYDSEYNFENGTQDELFWKAHQAQLVPCPKCFRTFYPDRLEIHLRGCKGSPKKKK
ncbi:zinc finger protein 474-like isoform X2 [Planococcus citri]|uniref:zinc finger protein 474-like isoform X2 n=1 Tax=Planococcus citri TaxID=170843 RepID=UPI0031F9001B